MNIDHKFNFGNLSWGKTNRLAQIFPNYHEGMSHKTVMLALDHPYFMGPVSGLEDPRKEIANLARFADAFSPAKGTLEYCCNPTITTPLVLRVTGGTSMTMEDKLSDEKIITSVEEAVRLNSAGVSASVFIGTKHQKRLLKISENLPTMPEITD
jgi:3-hydroxy-5-phosphonooxypentane-2,4-dione thiolase